MMSQIKLPTPSPSPTRFTALLASKMHDGINVCCIYLIPSFCIRQPTVQHMHHGHGANGIMAGQQHDNGTLPLFLSFTHTHTHTHTEVQCNHSSDRRIVC